MRVRAVRMRTGTSRVAAALASSSSTSNPSMVGIMRSRTIRSGRSAIASSRPASPDSAINTACPACSRFTRQSMSTSGSSSMTRTFATRARPPLGARRPYAGCRHRSSRLEQRRGAQARSRPVRPAQRGCAVDVPEARPYAGGVLKVSQKLEYAMRAMIELARHNDEGALLSARQIAERQQIPLRFLEQQLGALHKHGLVESFRGSGGGCRLSRPPEDIRVAHIVDALEGPLYPMGCLSAEDHTCFADAQCGLQE